MRANERTDLQLTHDAQSSVCEAEAALRELRQREGWGSDVGVTCSEALIALERARNLAYRLQLSREEAQCQAS